MSGDSDMQVWLEQVDQRPGIIAPYVLSETPREVSYRLRAVREGSNGRAIIGQSGAIRLVADIPTPLSRLSMAALPGEYCKIEVVLDEGGLDERRYVFACPS